MRIGVDLGGTIIEIAALDDAGQELFRKRMPSPRGCYEDTLKAVIGLVKLCEQETGARGTLGVGTPGAVSPTNGLLKNSNSTWLNGHPLGLDLEDRLMRQVRLANDADCLALSEATDGAAKGASSVFGVILGTGVGGGLVVHGRLVQGPNAIAGEWGHNPLPWPKWDERPGAFCYCGKRGCIETFLSGPGLSRDHYNLTRQRLSASEIASLCDGAHHLCEETLARYEDRLARALATVINVFDPEVIVLGGGVSNIGALYERVPRIWGRYVFSDQVLTRLQPAIHGDSSGVRGAACLWSVEEGNCAQHGGV